MSGGPADLGNHRGGNRWINAKLQSGLVFKPRAPLASIVSCSSMIPRGGRAEWRDAPSTGDRPGKPDSPPRPVRSQAAGHEGRNRRQRSAQECGDSVRSGSSLKGAARSRDSLLAGASSSGTVSAWSLGIWPRPPSISGSVQRAVSPPRPPIASCQARASPLMFDASSASRKPASGGAIGRTAPHAAGPQPGGDGRRSQSNSLFNRSQTEDAARRERRRTRRSTCLHTRRARSCAPSGPETP